MKISNKGIQAIKYFEGCKLKAYKDSVGIWTIGVGHIKNVTENMTITQEQAEQFLKEDLVPVEKFINGVGMDFTQNQYDALCSFAFNLGIGSLKSSTLLKKIKANAPAEDIRYQFNRWCRAGGKVVKGLQIRREKEADMYLDNKYPY